MESVPEAERMEEFRPSLLPSLSLPPTRLYRIAATELQDVKTAGENPITEAGADAHSDADSTMTTAAMAAGPPSAKPYPRLHPLPSDPDDEASVHLVRKPQTVRRSTDPTPGSLPSPLSCYYSPPITSTAAFTSFSASSPQLPYRPRTTSPLSSFTSLSSSSLSSSSSSSSHPAFTHTRSRSYASTLAPPPAPMSRTQSLPGFGNHHHLLPYSGRPASPSAPARPLARARRAPVDECFPPTSPVRQSVLDPDRRPAAAAAEWGEPATSGLGGSGGPVMSPGGSAPGPVKHRRPSSPLRNYHPAHSSSPSLGGAPPPLPSAPSSVTSSPSTRPIDSFSAVSGSSYGSVALFPLSSIPTTPTSARSRSPSISSLETIPDSPWAEEEALEEERIAQLKAAADAAAAAAEAVEPAGGGGDGADIKTGGGRGSLDVPPRGRTLTGLGFGSARDKRKRWSVCGAERRGDIDLETIWED